MLDVLRLKGSAKDERADRSRMNQKRQEGVLVEGFARQETKKAESDAPAVAA
jgi:hypothetical protein